MLTPSARRLLSLGKKLRDLYGNWRGMNSEFLVATAMCSMKVLALSTVHAERDGALEDYIAICRSEFDRACIIEDRVDAALLASIEPEVIH